MSTCTWYGSRVELHEQVALADPVVVVHQHPRDLPGTRGATNVTWPFT